MARQENLNNIPNSDVAKVVSDFKSEGATVRQAKNPDGTWNVTATWSVIAIPKDVAGNKLRKFWKPNGLSIDTDNEDIIKKWMTKHNLNGLSITGFIRSDVLFDARAKAVKELSLK